MECGQITSEVGVTCQMRINNSENKMKPPHDNCKQHDATIQFGVSAVLGVRTPPQNELHQTKNRTDF